MTKKPSIIVMLAALFCSFLAQAEDHAWVPLFDGESLEGWVQKNGYATYRVEDGMIVGKGPRIQTWVNGEQVSDLVHEPVFKSHPGGFIGLQVHGVGDRGPFQVAWRNIRIKPMGK